MLRVATLGAAFSANKGAASMLQAIIDRFPEEVGPCRFDVLTTYPIEDRATRPPDGVRIVPAKPATLLFGLLPLALLSRLLSVLGVPQRLVCRSAAARALLDADIVLDLAGISFSDGRGIPILVYNVAMTGLPLLLGKPVVKCSQALGPFEDVLNRGAAKLVLRRVAAICARGSESFRHVAELELGGDPPVVEAADLAFLMKVSEAAEQRADHLTSGLGADYVAVVPSAVVRGYCSRAGIDYVDIVATAIDRLLARGEAVVLLAHSVRPSDKESRMNDRPVCREIFKRASRSDRLLLLDDSESPSVLRALIGGASLLVTCRFHAMISALTTETPVMVVGWSHKYAEVVAEFGLSEYVLSYEQLSDSGLVSMIDRLRSNSGEVKQAVHDGLPAAITSSLRNFEAIRHVLAARRT